MDDEIWPNKLSMAEARGSAVEVECSISTRRGTAAAAESQFRDVSGSAESAATAWSCTDGETECSCRTSVSLVSQDPMVETQAQLYCHACN